MSSDPLVPPDHDLEPLPPHSSRSTHREPPGAPRTPSPSCPPDEAGKFTRAGALWTALIVGFVVLILLLVFIMQNMDPRTVHLFGWAWEAARRGRAAAGAIAGGLLTFLVGTARILQLRRAAKKNLKAGLLALLDATSSSIGVVRQWTVDARRHHRSS